MKVIKLILMLVISAFLLLNYLSPSLASFNINNLINRAGGGEDFGGGGYDFGGSDSSFDFGSSDSDFSSGDYTGSGSGDPVMGFVCCCIIVIIVIVIIVIDRISRRRGGPGIIKVSPSVPNPINTPTSNTSLTNKSMTSEELSTNLTNLKTVDPNFDEQAFKTHIKKVFMAVQEGWTKRDQAICRPFMSEEVYQSHQMQIDTMKNNKTINVLEKIVVGSTDIVRIDLGSQYHKIAVKVRAAMTDYKIKEDDPKTIIAGSKDQQPPFTEYWVFIRKSNLKTKVKDGIFDRKCPNCGAPISVDVAGICKYCNSNVVNGDYDWVLSEIVQKSEWSE